MFSKILFLWQILEPSVSRFLSDEVMVVSSTRSNPLTNPAVTFCPYNQTKYETFLSLSLGQGCSVTSPTIL